MLIFLVERWLNICFADFIGEYDDQGLNLGAFPKQVSDETIFSVILLWPIHFQLSCLFCAEVVLYCCFLVFWCLSQSSMPMVHCWMLLLDHLWNIFRPPGPGQPQLGLAPVSPWSSNSMFSAQWFPPDAESYIYYIIPLCVYIYIYVYICIHMYIYIYVCIHPIHPIIYPIVIPLMKRLSDT